MANEVNKRDDDIIPTEKLALLRNTIAKGSTAHEFDLFVQVCNRLRLDPFARQIFLVKRGGTASPQVSIDGFRLVAERTGQYRGQITPQWCGKDGVWTDVWLSDEPPAAARCGVFRVGFSEPLIRVAKHKSYFQRSNPLWVSMPEVMLSKCAEMLALRAAFPNELSGVYGVEEMGQANNGTPPAQAKRTLDDVSRDSEPPNVIQADFDAETGEIAQRLDEYGLPIPTHPCPVVQSAGKFAGKRWDELPGGMVGSMYTKYKDTWSANQCEWAEYLISKRACRKAAEHDNV